MTKTYYRFRQIPLYGTFYPPAEVVFVAAETAEEANLKVRGAGVSFGPDCDHGNCDSCRRWHPVSDNGRTYTREEVQAVSEAHLPPSDDNFFSILIVE